MGNDKTDKSAFMKKLEGLYKLAILNEGEEKDESRRIEAASSALLLLNLARKNGVKITFSKPDEDKKGASSSPTSKDEPREWWMDLAETFVSEASKRAFKDIVKDIKS